MICEAQGPPDNYDGEPEAGRDKGLGGCQDHPRRAPSAGRGVEGLMRREWRENAVFDAAFAPRPKLLCVAILSTVVIMVIGGLSQLLPVHWWMRSGLAANPGNFIARQPINYPVCAPWAGKSADFARSDLQVTDGISQEPVAAGDQTTLGIVLPAKARIVKIYCATGSLECLSGLFASCPFRRQTPSIRATAYSALPWKTGRTRHLR